MKTLLFVAVVLFLIVVFLGDITRALTCSWKFTKSVSRIAKPIWDYIKNQDKAFLLAALFNLLLAYYLIWPITESYDLNLIWHIISLINLGFVAIKYIDSLSLDAKPINIGKQFLSIMVYILSLVSLFI